VPNLVGVKNNKATAIWTTAGFTGSNLLFSPLAGNPPQTIVRQTLAAGGAPVPCTSTMTAFT
jgi:hypothetical protein